MIFSKKSFKNQFFFYRIFFRFRFTDKSPSSLLQQSSQKTAFRRATHSSTDMDMEHYHRQNQDAALFTLRMQPSEEISEEDEDEEEVHLPIPRSYISTADLQEQIMNHPDVMSFKKRSDHPVVAASYTTPKSSLTTTHLSNKVQHFVFEEPEDVSIYPQSMFSTPPLQQPDKINFFQQWNAPKRSTYPTPPLNLPFPGARNSPKRTFNSDNTKSRFVETVASNSDMQFMEGMAMADLEPDALPTEPAPAPSVEDKLNLTNKINFFRVLMTPD